MAASDLLTIPDLIVAIACHMSKKDMLHLGLTCKTIWLAVVEELWDCPVDIAMLSCIVPRDWIESDPELLWRDWIPEYSTLRDFSSSRWPLGKYLSLFRGLNLVDSCKLVTRGFSQASTCNNLLGLCEPLQRTLENLPRHPDYICNDIDHPFPRLKTVIFEGCPRSAAAARGLLKYGTDGVRLRIRDVTHTEEIDRLRRSLQSVAPTLKELSVVLTPSVRITPPKKGGVPDVLEEICDSIFSRPLPLLRSFKVQDIYSGRQLLPLLAICPHLEDLCLRMFCGEPFRAYDFPDHGFPGLRSLSIANHMVSNHAPNFLALLCAVSSNNIEALALGISEDQSCAAILNYIASRWSSTLKHIELRMDSMQSANGLELFSPLFSVRELQVFRLRGLQFSARDIERLPSIWPDLVELELTVTRSFSEADADIHPLTACFNQSSLLHLAGTLRQLRSLSLNALDFNQPIYPVLPPGIKSLSVECLRLTRATCSDPAKVVALIKTVFPCLKEFPDTHEGRATMEIGRLLGLVAGT